MVEPLRVELIAHPTALEFLPRLTEYLGGPRIYVKRDDNTGLGLGGNKIRKLEFLIADAQTRGADTLMTIGGLQSNHCRQTAAVAARFGFDCHLIVQEGALAREALFASNGNVLLDRLFGAQLHVIAADTNRDKAMLELFEGLLAEGRKPYLIPSGGSSAIGALGYVRAAEEIVGQCDGFSIEPSCIFQSSGSGGTQAGLLCGLAVLERPVPVRGIASSRKGPGEAVANIAALFEQAAERMGWGIRPVPHVMVDEHFVGGGYGVPTPEGVEAIRLCASLEGLLLDPVYTGKAMAGLIATVRNGEFTPDDTLIFLHTGGAPALFAYHAHLDLP